MKFCILSESNKNIYSKFSLVKHNLQSFFQKYLFLHHMQQAWLTGNTNKNRTELRLGSYEGTIQISSLMHHVYKWSKWLLTRRQVQLSLTGAGSHKPTASCWLAQEANAPSSQLKSPNSGAEVSAEGWERYQQQPEGKPAIITPHKLTLMLCFSTAAVCVCVFFFSACE